MKNHEDRKHHPYSPSTWERGIHCPASWAWGKDLPDETSEAARIGTLMHEMAEEVFMSEHQKAALIEDPRYEELFDEQILMVQEYVDYLIGCMEKESAVSVYCEMELFHEMANVGTVHGTADAIVFSGDCLEVVDFKSGRGDVQPNNPQMLAYLGFAREDYPTAKRFFSTIVQPRSGGIKSVEVTGAQIDDVMWDAELAMVSAASENPHCEAGDWCLWCKAKGKCPKHTAMLFEGIESDPKEIVLDKIELLPVTVCENYLRYKDQFAKWFASMEKVVETALKNGHKSECYKLVRGRKQRKWKDESATATKLGGILGEAMWSRKLITPAQAEKAMKDKALVAELAETPLGELCIADMDDRRPAENVIPAYITDFASEIL